MDQSVGWRRSGAPPFLEGSTWRDFRAPMLALCMVGAEVCEIASACCGVCAGSGSTFWRRCRASMFMLCMVVAGWVYWCCSSRLWRLHGFTGSCWPGGLLAASVDGGPPPTMSLPAPPLDPFDHELYCPVAGSILLRWGSEDRSAGSLAAQALFSLAPLGLWNYVSTDSWPMMMPLGLCYRSVMQLRYARLTPLLSLFPLGHLRDPFLPPPQLGFLIHRLWGPVAGPPSEGSVLLKVRPLRIVLTCHS